jgi:hypothetical protein
MEELERKNKGGGQPMTSRSRSNGFPSLRGGIDWWSCRSRSPLPNPSKICMNHWREERGSKLKRGNNGGGKYAQEHPRTHPNRWGRSPLYSKLK